MRISLIWLCILFFTKIHSQKYYEVYDSIYKNNYKIINNSFVDSLLILSNDDELSIQKISHAYSIFQYYKKKNVYKAIQYAEKEVSSFEKSNLINKKYTKALYNLGRFHYHNLQFDKAIENYKKVIKIDNDKKKTGQSYAELGRSYRDKNKFHKSINYFKKGILILEKLKEDNSLFSQYINLAITYDKIGDKKSIKKSFYYWTKAKELITSNKRLNTLSKTYSLNSGLAHYYKNIYEFDFLKSKKYFIKNLNLGLIKKDTFIIGNSYLNLGDLYLIKKNDSALYFFDKSLKYSHNLNSRKSEAYRYLSIYQAQRQKYNLALKSINKSISYLFLEKLDVRNIKNKQLLLSSYEKKVEILICIEDLELGIKTIKEADKVIGVLLENSSENDTKLFWRKEASEIYLKGVYIAQLLDNKELAFSFMEKNKALLLSESIAKNTERVILPKHISDKETAFKKLILSLENKVIKTLEKDKKDILQDSLFTAKQNFEKYSDSLKVIYPKYFSNQMRIEQVGLSETQENLGENDAIVSYIWNRFDDDTELVFGQLITKNNTSLFKIENIDSLRKSLKNYRKLIAIPLETKTQQQEFQKVSYTLSKLLFPEAIKQEIATKKLTIIPDGDLQSIPFEALITKENSFEYLLNSNVIGYSYSMSFLKYNNQVNRETNKSFIGYSPVNFENLSLEKLTHTEKETNSITEIIEGEALLQKAATKNHFLNESSTSKIIHLATHADASNNPWIAFADEKLELHELYTYKNNADLVVLSACNTSLGEVAVGEGVLSLARGFFYSGANTVVSSLWDVNDASTSGIMTDFYKNLKDGQDKAEALNNAKKNYLATHSLSEKSPYYWSSFVLIGNAEAIDVGNNYFLYLAILLIVVLGCFVLRKIKK